MLFQLIAPASNERGPRYMEKAFAALHQARPKHPVTLVYGVREGQIGLFLQCSQADRDSLIEPIRAGYPDATVTLVEERGSSAGEIWSTEIELVPELFPILRHAQFEDLLNHNFADPVSGLLRAILPEEGMKCRIEITIRPASRHRLHRATNAVFLLEREFFQRHHRLAGYFARNATRGSAWRFAWILGLAARCTPQPSHSNLDTSTSRLHEREDDLQAAADKLGGHLFDVQLRLIVEASPQLRPQAFDRLRRMEGALGAFTRSRLATFISGPVQHCRVPAPDSRLQTPDLARSAFLLSHEELATLWHPPTTKVQGCEAPPKHPLATRKLGWQNNLQNNTQNNVGVPARTPLRYTPGHPFQGFVLPFGDVHNHRPSELPIARRADRFRAVSLVVPWVADPHRRHLSPFPSFPWIHRRSPPHRSTGSRVRSANDSFASCEPAPDWHTRLPHPLGRPSKRDTAWESGST